MFMQHTHMDINNDETTAAETSVTTLLAGISMFSVLAYYTWRMWMHPVAMALVSVKTRDMISSIKRATGIQPVMCGDFRVVSAHWFNRCSEDAESIPGKPAPPNVSCLESEAELCSEKRFLVVNLDHPNHGAFTAYIGHVGDLNSFASDSNPPTTENR